MSEPPVETVVPEEEALATPPPYRPRGAVLIAAGCALALIVVVALTPFWAPAVMSLLPWGEPASPVVAAKPSSPAPKPAPTPGPDPALAALRAEIAQNTVTLQALGQRITALEAKPAPAPPDLSPIEQQLSALGKTTADLGASVAALQKAEPATDLANNTALALVLLQIREALEIGRPFAAEYQALSSLAKDHPEIAAAAQQLAEPATSGVASRAAVAERLRQLAPRIATAKPPAEPGWTSQIVGRLESLVTIRHLDGDAQSTEEVAVATAQRDLAGGDLAGAIAALSALTGPSAAAAAPWLQTARQRLAVEAALHDVAAAVNAAVGAAR
jgi:uroporphyrinogen-III synthase